MFSRHRGYLTCPEGGARLRREARDARRRADDRRRSVPDGARRVLPAAPAVQRDAAAAGKVLREILRRLGSCATSVSITSRSIASRRRSRAENRSGSISPRRQLGARGHAYVLDEPSIGLHSRDNERLIAILRQLQTRATPFVVEHDADMIRVADITSTWGSARASRRPRHFQRPLDKLLQEPRSLTASYSRDELAIPVPAVRRRPSNQRLGVWRRSTNPQGHRRRDPARHADGVTGVSGWEEHACGRRALRGAQARRLGRVGTHWKLGAEFVTDVVLVDQAPIGRTRSNPVTTKAFDPGSSSPRRRTPARAGSPPATSRSTCPADAARREGEARRSRCVLADVFVPCEVCEGKRFGPQVLEVKVAGAAWIRCSI